MSTFRSHDSEAEARREISRWSKARHSKPNVIERLSNNCIEQSRLDRIGIDTLGNATGGGGGGTGAEGGRKARRPQHTSDRDGRRGRALLDYLAAISPLAMIGLLFFLVFPPIFYDQIFLPCWECFDFEAVIAHEAGHVLGFDHPDTAPGENLEQVANLTNATCRSPWSVAQLTDYTQTEEGSIMHSLTRHNPVTCLSKSDMNGLYLLYPVRDEIIPTEVSCSKARRLSGFLRLASAVGLPLFIALLLVLLPLSCLRWRDARRIKSLTQDVEEAGSAMRSLRRTFAAGATSWTVSMARKEGTPPLVRK